MKIAICDDNETLSKQLKKMILSCGENIASEDDIFFFPLPSALYSYMESCPTDQPVHLIFMDLFFPDSSEDGIQWAKRLRYQFPQTLTIILTSYQERYKEGYVARAFRFMTKPIDQLELKENLEACQTELQLNETIHFVRHGIEHNIPIQDILYLSAQSGGSELWTSSNAYFFEESLVAWEEKLPACAFFRCHKKYLVNLKHIASLEQYSLLLYNSEKLPISRRKWTSLQVACMKYDIARGCRFNE